MSLFFEAPLNFDLDLLSLPLRSLTLTFILDLFTFAGEFVVLGVWSRKDTSFEIRLRSLLVLLMLSWHSWRFSLSSKLCPEWIECIWSNPSLKDGFGLYSPSLSIEFNSLINALSLITLKYSLSLGVSSASPAPPIYPRSKGGKKFRCLESCSVDLSISKLVPENSCLRFLFFC